MNCCRSQWPRGLRRRSAAERLLGSWVRIPPEEWMFILYSVLCCQVEVSATGRSLVQGSPTECGLCLSVIKWKIKTLYTYCEQVGRRGKDYETKRNELFSNIDVIRDLCVETPVIVAYAGYFVDVYKVTVYGCLCSHIAVYWLSWLWSCIQQVGLQYCSS
jgi:hypothetical protein